MAFGQMQDIVNKCNANK